MAQSFDPATLIHPIIGPCAWTGPEMARLTDWLHVFAPAEIAEIEATVAAVKARSLSILDIGQADFPLPTLAPVLARVRDDLVDGSGISVMRGLPVDRWSREETAIAYWGLGAHLGDAVSQNPDGHMLGHVKDIGGDFHSLTSRAGYQSHARLPFHTDVGADLVGLLCLHPSKIGGESSVTSAAAVHNAMLERRPDLLRLLAAPIHRDRRGEYLAGKAPTYEAPVFCHHAGHMTVTFVRRFIESAPRHPGVPPVTPALIEAMDLLEALAESDALRLDMDFQAGDIQWINNLTTFHSRTEYEDWREPARRRHLLRLWLNLPNGWPLPPSYYERFGSAGDDGRPKGMHMPGVALSAPLDVG
jgi:Taurine catabolism dioxygenase TauD, TfdA family